MLPQWNSITKPQQLKSLDNFITLQIPLIIESLSAHSCEKMYLGLFKTRKRNKAFIYYRR